VNDQFPGTPEVGNGPAPCGECNDTGRIFVELKLDGRVRSQFVDCGCRKPDTSRRSARFKAPAIKIPFGLRGDCQDYRDDLARFPGDPEARVDGPAAVQRLIDKRKREGWQFHESWAAAADAKPTVERKTSEEIAREAYERARDNNFDDKE
jgi:hypothetical protein